MLTVYPDAEITRRKRHHYILDENAKLKWTGALMGDCLIHLYETGHYEFLVQTAESKFKVTLRRDPS